MVIEPESSSRPELVAILGAGMMGSGIAQICLAHGYEVNLYGRSEGKLSEAAGKIEKGLCRSAAKDGKVDQENAAQWVHNQMALLHISTDVEDAVKEADYVIEAVIEDLALKRQLLTQVNSMCKSSALIVTNTSSIRLMDLADCISPSSRFGGLHFFNPVPVLKLVEVISTPVTSEKTAKRLNQFCLSLGKIPIACKDTPGFVVNRLLVPYLIDSIRMLERGDATKEDIDAAMRCGTAYPMGPLELCDYVGLDTIQNVMKVWRQSMPNDSRFVPCPLLDQLVAEGRLGRKVKKGFYDY